MWNSFFKHKGSQFSQPHLLDSPFFPHYLLCHFQGPPDTRSTYTKVHISEVHIGKYVNVCFGVFCPVALVHLFVLQLISHCFKDQSFIINLEGKMSPSLFLFFKIFLITLGPLFFHMYFRISLSNLVKSPVKSGIRRAINLQINLGKN